MFSIMRKFVYHSVYTLKIVVCFVCFDLLWIILLSNVFRFNHEYFFAQTDEQNLVILFYNVMSSIADIQNNINKLSIF
jgi:hypothetical protein